ncbi:hypothetical protein [Rhizobium rhizogenes]|uniref:Uncharacterized protein n=1 Tax=Rhizobium rhizogenes NBRC 13257 TaxID=1220581 RepID=A0AA87Q881_RHIRH|nr:hypothetical protein [Rhizobium rhizogenes]NTG60427.1 hypothetical protein [Rhizobium rhizogenes]NTG66977.1 hypothetical protein [Rhizobium rhizogenes]NTG79949.1 hypothetical protein [Rhizobium rhizogenes]NTH95630.1 hypothetical protein [Rhizobium rhizogenes]NTI67841.1 hypothetical protein [Rhizobium rhizogenes]
MTSDELTVKITDFRLFHNRPGSKSKLRAILTILIPQLQIEIRGLQLCDYEDGWKVISPAATLPNTQTRAFRIEVDGPFERTIRRMAVRRYEKELEAFQRQAA